MSERVCGECTACSQEVPCLWKLGLLKEGNRPDKCKVVFHVKMAQSGQLVLWVREVESPGLSSRLAQINTALNLRELHNPVVQVPVVGNLRLYLPPGIAKADCRITGDREFEGREVEIFEYSSAGQFLGSVQ